MFLFAYKLSLKGKAGRAKGGLLFNGTAADLSQFDSFIYATDRNLLTVKFPLESHLFSSGNCVYKGFLVAGSINFSSHLITPVPLLIRLVSAIRKSSQRFSSLLKDRKQRSRKKVRFSPLLWFCLQARQTDSKSNSSAVSLNDAAVPYLFCDCRLMEIAASSTCGMLSLPNAHQRLRSARNALK